MGYSPWGCRVRHDQSGLAYRNMQECVVPNEPLSSPPNLVTHVGSWVQQELGLANTVRTQSPRCKFGGGDGLEVEFGPLWPMIDSIMPT